MTQTHLQHLQHLQHLKTKLPHLHPDKVAELHKHFVKQGHNTKGLDKNNHTDYKKYIDESKNYYNKILDDKNKAYIDLATNIYKFDTDISNAQEAYDKENEKLQSLNNKTINKKNKQITQQQQQQQKTKTDRQKQLLESYIKIKEQHKKSYDENVKELDGHKKEIDEHTNILHTYYTPEEKTKLILAKLQPNQNIPGLLSLTTQIEIAKAAIKNQNIEHKWQLEQQEQYTQQQKQYTQQQQQQQQQNKYTQQQQQQHYTTQQQNKYTQQQHYNAQQKGHQSYVLSQNFAEKREDSINKVNKQLQEKLVNAEAEYAEFHDKNSETGKDTMSLLKKTWFILSGKSIYNDDINTLRSQIENFDVSIAKTDNDINIIISERYKRNAIKQAMLQAKHELELEKKEKQNAAANIRGGTRSSFYQSSFYQKPHQNARLPKATRSSFYQKPHQNARLPKATRRAKQSKYKKTKVRIVNCSKLQ